MNPDSVSPCPCPLFSVFGCYVASSFNGWNPRISSVTDLQKRRRCRHRRHTYRKSIGTCFAEWVTRISRTWSNISDGDFIKRLNPPSTHMYEYDCGCWAGLGTTNKSAGINETDRSVPIDEASCRMEDDLGRLQSETFGGICHKLLSFVT